MRALGVGIGLAAALGVFAVAAAKLSSVSPILGERTPASENTACAPGPDFSAAVCRASQADPDAPIATARIAPEEPPPAAGQVQAAAPVTVIQLAAANAGTVEPAAPARIRRPIEVPPVLAAVGAPIDAPSPALTLHQTWAERTTTRLQPAVLSPRNLALSSALRQRLEAARYVGHRARMFLFVGGGQDVFAYNFTRAEGDIRIAGWSMERTVQMGEQQIGLAWQSGRMRVAVAGIQRKVSQLGVSLKDNVAAISLTFNTGDFGQNRNDAPRRW
jgi:hypothetical protein